MKKPSKYSVLIILSILMPTLQIAHAKEDQPSSQHEIHEPQDVAKKANMNEESASATPKPQKPKEERTTDLFTDRRPLRNPDLERDQ